jgi:hypothetical protein
MPIAGSSELIKVTPELITKSSCQIADGSATGMRIHHQKHLPFGRRRPQDLSEVTDLPSLAYSLGSTPNSHFVRTKYES